MAETITATINKFRTFVNAKIYNSYKRRLDHSVCKYILSPTGEFYIKNPSYKDVTVPSYFQLLRPLTSLSDEDEGYRESANDYPDESDYGDEDA